MDMDQWGNVERSISLPGDCDFSLATCNIPGLSTATREQLNEVRAVYSQVGWFGRLVTSFCKDIGKNPFHVASRDARTVLVQSEIPLQDMPFRSIERKGTPAELDLVMTDQGAVVCAVPWGPLPGPVRDLLSPANMLLMTLS